MPRLPFLGHRDVATLFPHRLRCVVVATAITIVALGLQAGSAFAAPPAPSIQAVAGTRGQAPFTIHVNALSSALNAGNESTARHEWNFGDAGGAYNTLVGWNAAHTYDQPGVYALTLRVINANREAATTSLQIIVDPPARSAIYVSPSGSDSNSGSSPSSPVRTVARVDQLLGSNKAVYFQRGGVYDTTSSLYIGGQNVLLSAYGSGADPVLHFSSAASYTNIIKIGEQARDVVIENLQFDSPFALDIDIVRGIDAHGTNITVRRCRFGDLSYAITTAGDGITGLFTLQNSAPMLGGYYVWAEGTDHTHVGNVVGGSVIEHDIRLGGASRLLIAYNDLTNVGKSGIWCMLGDHCYIASNKLRSGRVIAGPNYAVGSASERFRFVAIEGNEFFDAGVVLYDGAENIALRNNVFHYSGADVISIWGYAPERGRTVQNVAVVNNTAINTSGDYGKFLRIGAGAQNIVIANNLFDAPSLNGHNGGNVLCDDAALLSNTSHHNIWAVPAVGPRYHSLAGSALSGTQWDILPQTTGEVHRDFGPADLNSAMQPQFNANVGVPVAGVFTDFYGNTRSSSGAWTAGAVAGPSSGGGGGGGGDGGLADINNDGDVDVDDLLAVILDWGTCSGCPADITNDGAVDVDDLVAVIMGWS